MSKMTDPDGFREQQQHERAMPYQRDLFDSQMDLMDQLHDTREPLFHDAIAAVIPTVPKSTPWGAWDHCEQIAPGIFTVSTPSHGGIYCDHTRNMQIPPYARSASGWYEEDCDWAIPFTFHADAIQAAGNPGAIRSLASAPGCLKRWSPEIWEAHTGKTLQPGESYTKDSRIFHKEHAGQYFVASASAFPLASFHANEPQIKEGEVLIWARPIPHAPYTQGEGAERKYVASAQAYRTAQENSPHGTLIASIEGARQVA